MKRLALLALVALVAACNGDGGATTTATGPSTTSTPIVTTPTTDPGEDCRRLAADAYEYLASVVEELQGLTVDQLEDRAQWPEALVQFEAQGEELDRRAAEFDCDPGAIQQDVLVRASALPWIVVNPAHVLGPGDRHNWSRLIVMIDRGRLPGIPPGTGSFADVRQVARAQVQAWQRQRFGQAYVLGGEHASFLDFVLRVGTALGRPTPRRAMPRWALMTYARVLDAWSRLSGKEPQVTTAGAALTSHHLRASSAKAVKELGYAETPLDSLLSDTLGWMRAEGLLGTR